jgi:hypothetical protein
MSIDDLLLAIIIAGFVLSGAYMRAQYATRRSNRTAERRNELRLSELMLRRNSQQPQVRP